MSSNFTGLKTLDSGTKMWYLNGKFHRVDGPAVDYEDGTKYWYLNGELHREDGPAIEWNYGHKEWYYHGEEIKCSSNEEFLRLIKLKTFW